MAVLSFNGNKIITTSGGGMLLSSRRDWMDLARFLATQARDFVGSGASARLFEHRLCLPSATTTTMSERARVLDALKRALSAQPL